MKWVRRDNLRNVGDEGLVFTYTLEGGGNYPRISLMLEEDSLVGLCVGCAYKHDSKAWWRTIPLPVSLVGEASKLLDRVESGGASTESGE